MSRPLRLPGLIYLLGVALLSVLIMAACGSEPPASPPDNQEQEPTATSESISEQDPTATPDSGGPSDGPEDTPTPDSNDTGDQSPGGIVTPTPVPIEQANVPEPQAPVGTIRFAIAVLNTCTGINSAQAPELFHHNGITETFFIPEGDNIVTGWLAEEWKVSDDLTQGTITLQQGVQFHDGWGEMTAEDAAWSMNNASGGTNPESIHGQAGDFAALFGEWEAVDTYTVQFPFNQFDSRWASNFLNQFGQSVSIFSKSVFDEQGAEWMRNNVIGTGPYKAIECLPQDRVIAEKAPSHWRFDAQVERIEQLVIADASSRMAGLETGQIDVTDVPPKDRRRFLDRGFRFASSGLAVQLGVFFSGNLWEKEHALTGEPLDRPTYAHDIAWIGDPDDEADMEEARKVRWAMAMAMDKELLNEVIVDDIGWPVHLEYLSIRSPHWQDKWNVPYDPDESRSLLDSMEGECNYVEQISSDQGACRFNASIYVGPEFGGGSQWPGEMGDAIAGMWGDIGIETQVLKYSYPTFRPSLVQRTNTLPFITSCDEGKDTWPWDWPKGLVMTSMTRGGFSCSLESPWIAQNFLEQTRTLDLAERIEMTNAWADYMHHWMLAPGIVAVPTGAIYNPNSIESWDIRPSGFAGTNSWWAIQPAR